MPRYEVAIVGAGPYGLAAVAHLRAAGVDAHIHGDPMSFWRTMPKGMLLRSNRTATSMIDYRGPLSLEAYAAEIGEPVAMPFPLHRFVDYGMWTQRKVASDLDPRMVASVERHLDGFCLHLTNGERLLTRRVVIAGGISPFVHRPSIPGDVPRTSVSHTSEHSDYSSWAGRRVLVVGGGQSALESAALLREAGASVAVAVRANRVNWLHGGKYHRRLGRAAKLVYAPTDVGPMGLSRIVAVPDAFRRLPRPVQEPLAYRAIRPAGAAWLVPRLREVPVHLGVRIRSAAGTRSGELRVELSDGTVLVLDHLLLGTGYRVDVARYQFLAPELVRALHTVNGYPVLRSGMESSMPGLHFVGAPAAWSFGPIMRFVSGSWYASRSLVKAVTGTGSRASDEQGIRAGVAG